MASGRTPPVPPRPWAERVRARADGGRGLSPEQALLTATRNAAEAGRGDRLGTLEPGKLADLLVVEGEPGRDVRVLQIDASS
jgi:imidazolonepropionase-like amidohydrolase